MDWPLFWCIFAATLSALVTSGYVLLTMTRLVLGRAFKHHKAEITASLQDAVLNEMRETRKETGL